MECKNPGQPPTPFRVLFRQIAFPAAFFLCALLFSNRTDALQLPNQPDADEDIPAELSAMGKDGAIIAHARERVLLILEEPNACSAWFQESDPDPAAVFRSLHFDLDREGPSRIYQIRNSAGSPYLKHPWGARSFEDAGRGGTIWLNANGAFFHRTSQLMHLISGTTVAWTDGNHTLTIARYNGDSPEAQIIILLHELGHIIGRLPEDNGSWEGSSSRNTDQVLRHCKAATSAAVRSFRASK